MMSAPDASYAAPYAVGTSTVGEPSNREEAGGVDYQQRQATTTTVQSESMDTERVVLAVLGTIIGLSLLGVL